MVYERTIRRFAGLLHLDLSFFLLELLCKSFFYFILELPNLIVLEFMANGALDSYLQVQLNNFDFANILLENV